jgi:hypothetical protein
MPWTQEVLTVVNSGLNVRPVMHMKGGGASRRLGQNGKFNPDGNHLHLGNSLPIDGILEIVGNSDIQIFQYSCSAHAGKWITETQVDATSCTTECVYSMSYMIVKTQKAVQLSSFKLVFSKKILL